MTVHFNLSSLDFSRQTTLFVHPRSHIERNFTSYSSCCTRQPPSQCVSTCLIKINHRGFLFSHLDALKLRLDCLLHSHTRKAILLLCAVLLQSKSLSPSLSATLSSSTPRSIQKASFSSYQFQQISHSQFLRSDVHHIQTACSTSSAQSLPPFYMSNTRAQTTAVTWECVSTFNSYLVPPS